MELGLVTTGDVMRRLGLSRAKANYWLEVSGARPVGRVGIARIYQPAAIDAVQSALNRHRAKATAAAGQLTPA